LYIYNCHGYELVKAQSNTSEDFFNRSEVEYEYNGQKVVTSVLYVRFFEEQLPELSEVKTTVLYDNGEESIYFRDLVALAFIINNPSYRGRKRIYINEINEFVNELKGVDFDQLVGYARGIKQSTSKRVEVTI